VGTIDFTVYDLEEIKYSGVVYFSIYIQAMDYDKKGRLRFRSDKIMDFVNNRIRINKEQDGNFDYEHIQKLASEDVKNEYHIMELSDFLKEDGFKMDGERMADYDQICKEREDAD